MIENRCFFLDFLFDPRRCFRASTMCSFRACAYIKEGGYLVRKICVVSIDCRSFNITLDDTDYTPARLPDTYLDTNESHFSPIPTSAVICCHPTGCVHRHNHPHPSFLSAVFSSVLVPSPPKGGIKTRDAHVKPLSLDFC